MRTGTTIMHRALCASPDTNPMLAECQYVTEHMRLHAFWRERYALFLEEYFSAPEELDEFTREIIGRFLARAERRHPSARTLVLKSPDLTAHFPTLGAWFAGAKFVVMVRDPRDTIASILDVAESHRAGGHSTELTALGRNMERLAAYYKSYYAALTEDGGALADRLAIIRYEDFVTDPARTLDLVAQFCGIRLGLEDLDEESRWRGEGAWERMEEAPYYGAFWSPLWRRGLSKERVGRYHEQLSPEDVRRIERECEDFNLAFPYW